MVGFGYSESCEEWLVRFFFIFMGGYRFRFFFSILDVFSIKK